MLDGLTEFLLGRGITLVALGGAYLMFLGNLVAGVACFVGSRAWLVVSPNRAAKHYALYVIMVLVSLCIATVLENELAPRAAVTLQYAALPHILALTMLHVWVYYEQEPWLIALGGSANAGAGVTLGVSAALGHPIPIAQWLTLAGIGALLAYLAYYSVSTKRGFVNATSIYLGSKEARDKRVAPQTPWLGLLQWGALIGASIVLATANAVLRGSELSDVPAVAVALQSTFILAVTVLVCAVPAGIYWLAHRHWMPELTRFVWLVWLVVGFAFTYGNFLSSLDRV
jgi:hypothetical protein